MNILAIDFGTKYIGLAKWHSEVDVVVPFGVVNSLEKLVKLLKQNNFDKIVIGLPLGLDSKENINTTRVRKFVEDLKQFTEAPVELVDERFTSQQADRLEDGVSRDEKSAMIILRSYLDKTTAKKFA